MYSSKQLFNAHRLQSEKFAHIHFFPLCRGMPSDKMDNREPRTVSRNTEKCRARQTGKGDAERQTAEALLARLWEDSLWGQPKLTGDSKVRCYIQLNTILEARFRPAT